MFIDPRKKLNEEIMTNPNTGNRRRLPYPPGPQTPPPFDPFGENPPPWNNYPPIYNPNSDPNLIDEPPYPLEPSPTGSKRNPRPIDPSKGPPIPGTPLGVPDWFEPDYLPENIPGLGPEYRWFAYYYSWYRYWVVQLNLLQLNRDILIQEYEARVCDGSSTSACRRLETQIQRALEYEEFVLAKMERLEKVLNKWITRIWRNMPAAERERSRRKFDSKKGKGEKGWRKWLRRFAGVLPQEDGPLLAQFGVQDTYTGKDIIRILQAEYEQAAMMGDVPGGMGVGMDTEQALQDLADLFNPGQQYTIAEIMEILYGEIVIEPMQGQTTTGTYSQGGQFGAEPTPMEPSPPEEPAKPEGEMARAFAKFNKSRMGRGIR